MLRATACTWTDRARSPRRRARTYGCSDLACGTGYTVGVDAFDGAGNRSRQTSTFVSTAACRDVTASKRVPTGVHSAAATAETSVDPRRGRRPGRRLRRRRVRALRWRVLGRTVEPAVGDDHEPLRAARPTTIGISAARRRRQRPRREHDRVLLDRALRRSHGADRRRPASPSAKSTHDHRRASPGPPRPTRRASPSTGSTRKGRRSAVRRRPREISGGLECGRTYTFGVDAADGGAEQVCRRDAVGGDCALPHHHHTAPAASPDDGLDGPDGAGEPSNDLGHADDGRRFAWDLEHRPADGMAGDQIFAATARRSARAPASTAGLTNDLDRPLVAPAAPQYRLRRRRASTAPATSAPRPRSTSPRRHATLRRPRRRDPAAPGRHAPAAPARPRPRRPRPTRPRRRRRARFSRRLRRRQPSTRTRSRRRLVVLRRDSSTDRGRHGRLPDLPRRRGRSARARASTVRLANQWTHRDRTCGTTYRLRRRRASTAPGNGRRRSSTTLRRHHHAPATAAAPPPPPPAGW